MINIHCLIHWAAGYILKV